MQLRLSEYYQVLKLEQQLTISTWN